MKYSSLFSKIRCLTATSMANTPKIFRCTFGIHEGPSDTQESGELLVTYNYRKFKKGTMQYFAKFLLTSYQPRKILYLKDYLPLNETRQQAIIDGFAQDIAQTFKAPVTKLSLSSVWGKNNISGDDGESGCKFLIEFEFNEETTD